MAIERFTTNNSRQNIANVIDSLGWFDAVLIENGRINCYIGDDYYLSLILSSSSSFQFYPFGFKRCNEAGGAARTINEDAAYLSAFYGYKTKNGLFFMSDINPSSNRYYNAWIIAKTNNNKIAVVFPAHCRLDTCGYFQSCAVEEPNLNDGYPAVGFKSMDVIGQGAWPHVSQIATAPIPTRPTSGTSYIKGALGFVMAPFAQAGIVEINGIKYATNGVLALNDED